MSIQVNPTVSPRIITVPETDGDSITIQSLVNQIRDWEDEQANLCYPSLLAATGKEVIDANTKVGITATLQNTKLKFEGRTSPTVCSVSGGNLVAVDTDGYSMAVIEPSTNVSVMLSQSSSATILQSDVIDDIQVQVGEVQYQAATIQETVDAVPTTLSETHGTGSWEGAIEFVEE